MELQCIQRGIHLFIEKPLSCAPVEDVEQLAQVMRNVSVLTRHRNFLRLLWLSQLATCSGTALLYSKCAKSSNNVDQFEPSMPATTVPMQPFPSKNGGTQGQVEDQ